MTFGAEGNEIQGLFYGCIFKIQIENVKSHACSIVIDFRLMNVDNIQQTLCIRSTLDD